MNISDTQIDSIVDRLVGQIIDTKAATGEPIKVTPPLRARLAPSSRHTRSTESVAGHGAFRDVESAVMAAEAAYFQFQDVPKAVRARIIDAIRSTLMDNLENLARMAREETGLGRFEDKLAKNKLAIEKTPGIEDIIPEAFSGDDGLTLQERLPFGVIGSITPCTNPTETIICNGIGMIAGGNTVAFNPHPSAKRISAYTVDLMNQAAMSQGAPANLFTTVSEPTIQSAQALMNHPNIRLLVVTGGPAVVNTAMKSGKRVIAAGPGNPPVVVDETADIDAAAKHIITSASTDNNIICVVEKEIIVVEKVADQLKRALVKHGGYEVGSHQTRRLEKLIIDKDDHVEKRFVGKDVQVILGEIGIEVGAEKRLAFCETKGDHPFATKELLMPVLPFIRVPNIDAAIDLAHKLENGCHHTAVIHSKNIDNMHKMARRMNCSIFVKNGPALAGLALGGEGPTSFTIASPTGEGLTTARHFTRVLRCVLKGHFGSAQ